MARLDDSPAHDTRDDERRDDQSPSLAPEQDERSGQGHPANRDRQRPQPTVSDRLAALRRHPYITAAVIIVILAVLVAAAAWWLHARHFESTDDAFVDSRVTAISSQVAGAIVDVPVTDNEEVRAGAVLVQIDQRNYRAAVAQAQGSLAETRARVSNYDAQIDAQGSQIEQAQKQVEQAQAALTFSTQENERYQKLLQQGSGTEQRAQQAASDLTQRRAALESARALLTTAVRQLKVLQTQRQGAAAQVEEAEAALEKAQADLSRTTIVAPEAGRVGKLSAARGAYAQPGQSLMMFVPSRLWITANFKETQLTDMRPGQPVSIRIDAYPDRDFRGHVVSLQPGSGTAFSLLPAENATGNYVKVVQRVPVKIEFDEHVDVYIGPGMSVVPTVRVR